MAAYEHLGWCPQNTIWRECKPLDEGICEYVPNMVYGKHEVRGNDFGFDSMSYCLKDPKFQLELRILLCFTDPGAKKKILLHDVISLQAVREDLALIGGRTVYGFSEGGVAQTNPPTLQKDGFWLLKAQNHVMLFKAGEDQIDIWLEYIPSWKEN